jgi:predicted component of type VI protein secretion system
MIRDFSTEQVAKDVDRVKELIKQKGILEAHIVQEIINFEDEYKVIIDKVRFQRLVTRDMKTVYTELTLLVE